MSDDRWEPLERLATLAPPPPPGMADAVVERARRRRRGAAAVLASTATVLAVVVGAVVWNGSSEGSAEPAVVDRTPLPTGSSAGPPPGDAGPGGRLAMVAAGIEYQLIAVEAARPQRILVSDRLCDQPRQATTDDRDCRPWGLAAQGRLGALLGGVAPVTFVRNQPTVTARRPFVLVAAIDRVSARRGSVYVYVLDGGRSCLGNDYVLERSRSGWSVVDEKGFMVVC